ncbi:Stp1/IreP family PP2C-type Ser/Thr phosphatase [Nocardiopsis sp. EMB25]|uniref:Stp1/IreP family PP2C-type Ser/Thr phosphatase n=1 Tax=Nocardiopsis sp. EMB25 TaxID=2835867 RepID=UPI002284657E|nr:Stp1/IreP family PP2C-type Ser/Thr phosphatase [Nocardiopsis sp. EMB25]MCY9786525.1 Stp1/IreP family PP2C-type Ser/Thr phosphatase [Nocardiopsis sp. EMB25]
MTIALRYAAYSDVGCLREGNEDSGYAGQHLLAVADGMGGYAGGEVASSIAISTIRRLDTEPHGTEEMAESLQRAVEQANASLSRRILAEPQLENMGTTLTAMLWSGPRVALIHIGDSRAYLLRGPRFEQITHDHTLVQTLVDEGKITEEEVATHPQRSLILRALDGKSPVDPDISISEAKPGDRYLLCSDGLSGVVTKKTIHETLATEADPRVAAKKLIELAIRGGGPDNITAVIADVIETETDREGPTAEPQVVGAADQRSEVDEQAGDTPARRAQELRGSGGDTAEMDRVEDVAAPGYSGPYEEPHDDFDDRPARGRGRGRGPEEPEPEYRTRRWWPVVVAFLVIVALVAGVAYYFGRQYVDSQFYVGPSASGDTVSIYQGIDTDIAGFSLSEEIEASDIRMDELSEGDRSTVQNTIPVESLEEARGRIEDLNQNLAEAAENDTDREDPRDTGSEDTGTADESAEPTEGAETEAGSTDSGSATTETQESG